MQNGILPQNELPVHAGDWYFIFALITFVLFVIVRWINPRYISRLVQATLSNYEAHRLITDKNIRMQQALTLLFALTIIGISLFWIMQMAAFPGGIEIFPSFLHFLKIITVVGVLVAIRLLAVRLIGVLFQIREVTRKINQIWIVQIHFLGIIIGFVAVLFPYLPFIGHQITAIAGYSLMIIWVIYNIIRQLQLLTQNHISLFYRILYLCAFEILPWWWIIQIAIKGWKD